MLTRLSLPLLVAACLCAQPKPTLKPADYAKWETLGQAAISPDGKWVAYDIRRTGGDNELRISPAAGGKPYTVAFCSQPAFSADSKWLACEATVSETDQDKLRKARKPVQNKLQIVDLSTGAATAVDDIQSFAFSTVDPQLAFKRYPPARENAGAPNTATPPAGGRGNAPAPQSDPTGAALTVRNLSTG